MKIGLVKHLNAKPLTFFFQNNPNFEILEDHPSALKEQLISGNLDIALISSVECERNRDILEYSTALGIAGFGKIQSILFYKNDNWESSEKNTIFADTSSLTSVSLLHLLLLHSGETGFSIEPMPPELIQKNFPRKQNSFMLIGDHALSNPNPEGFQPIDLCEWWTKEFQLPFVFAFWAYRKGVSFDTELFLNAYHDSMSKIDTIVSQEQRFSPEITKQYLTKDLHFLLSEKDLLGFQKFIEKLKSYELF